MKPIFRLLTVGAAVVATTLTTCGAGAGRGGGNRGGAPADDPVRMRTMQSERAAERNHVLDSADQANQVRDRTQARDQSGLEQLAPGEREQLTARLREQARSLQQQRAQVVSERQQIRQQIRAATNLEQRNQLKQQLRERDRTRRQLDRELRTQQRELRRLAQP